VNDIFISYASKDIVKAKMLADILSQKGLSVWWDRTILPGEKFDQVIEEALDNSKCVIVLWSKASIISDWVKSEAAEGASRNILVPVLIEDIKIPLQFRRIQTAYLTDWNGEPTHPELCKLFRAILSILNIPLELEKKTINYSTKAIDKPIEAKNIKFKKNKINFKIEYSLKVVSYYFLLMIVGWSIFGIIFYPIFDSFSMPFTEGLIRGFSSGSFGGFFTGLALKQLNKSQKLKKLITLTINWGICWLMIVITLNFESTIGILSGVIQIISLIISLLITLYIFEVKEQNLKILEIIACSTIFLFGWLLSTLIVFLLIPSGIFNKIIFGAIGGAVSALGIFLQVNRMRKIKKSV